MDVQITKSKVSVIVPVYNAQPYLFECVDSILRQTYKNLEILLIDDGSTDNSGNICDQYTQQDKRVICFHKKNGGVSSARNLGINHASGDYLMFVDGDDWLEADAIEIMLKTLTENKSDACFCDRYFKDQTEIVLHFDPSVGSFVESKTLLRTHLRYRFTASACMALYNLNKIKRILFDTSILSLEYWEYLFRVLTQISSASICHASLYHYRTSVGSASKSPINEKKMTCFLIPDKVNSYLIDHHLPYLEEAADLPAILLIQMLVRRANYFPTVTKFDHELKKIAQRYLKQVIFSNQLNAMHKIYILATAINTKLFCTIYNLKRRRRIEVAKSEILKR